MADIPFSRRKALNASASKMKFPSNVAEPMVRKVPSSTNISSSVSKRDAATGVSAIRNICQFYVDKCSGKYENNVMAARYVHQLAEEVLIQLEAVKESIAQSSSSAAAAEEPKYAKAESSNLSARMEDILNEWNEYFPPSLGKIGTPKGIARKIDVMNKEMNNLRESMKKSSEAHQLEAVELQNQLRKSQSSCLAEREKLVAEMQRKETHLVESFKSESARSLAYYIEDTKDKLQRLNREWAAKLNIANTDNDKLRRALDKRTAENTFLEVKFKKQKERLNELVLEVKKLKSGSSSASVSSVHDMAEDIEKSEKEEEEAEREDLRRMEVVGYRGSERAGEGGNESKGGVVGHTEESEVKLGDKLMRISLDKEAKAARRISELETKGVQDALRVERVEGKLDECMDSLTRLQAVDAANKEHIDYLIRRCASLEDHNNSLREALGRKLHSTDAPKYILKYTPKPIAHTPDFLQKADRSIFLD